MLSICIPVYNFNVTSLVKSLNKQASILGIVYEIIVIDDCSTNPNKSINKELQTIESTLYIELEINIGRSAIRNLFLKYAKFEYLLFLDCDSQIIESQFIENYVKQCNNAAKVVCGGRIYPPKQINRKTRLRWKYGVYRECIVDEKRGKNPYNSFMTNNFLIQKIVLDTIKFEEKLTGYGHEDSLFGYRLKQLEVPVFHIQNPVVHDYTEFCSEFLRKTRQGLKNLYFIKSEMKLGNDFDNMIKLLKVHSMVKRYFLQIPVLLLYILTKPIILASFHLGTISLKVFDFYKLGYFIMIDLWPRANQKPRF